MSGIRSGELFAGVGGLGMAVDEVFDATPAWFCEFDDAPSKVLAHHFPGIPNFGDVRAVKWTPDCPTCGEPTGLLWRRDEFAGPVRKEYHCREHGWFPLDIRLADPDADRIPEGISVAAGGFPCQDVSLAGRRRGLKDGTRSGLWSEFAKAIDQIRPDWVVIENVRGLLSADAAGDVEPCPLCVGDDPGHVLRALGAVLGDLADLGFDAEWTGIRAADVGAPHGRFRVFILAWPRERTTQDSGRGRGRRGTTASGRGEGARSDAPSHRSDPRDDRAPQAADVSLLPTPGAYDGERGGSQHPDKRRAGNHSVTIQDVAEHLHLLPTPMVGSSNPAAHGQISGDFRSAMDRVIADVEEATTEWGPYETAIRRWESIVGRPAPAPVRFDGKGGKPRLNPELTEWMMGWPLRWVTASVIGLTRAEQLKACGNGVVPQQAAAALRMLLARPGVPEIACEMAA